MVFSIVVLADWLENLSTSPLLSHSGCSGEPCQYENMDAPHSTLTGVLTNTKYWCKVILNVSKVYLYGPNTGIGGVSMESEPVPRSILTAGLSSHYLSDGLLTGTLLSW